MEISRPLKQFKSLRLFINIIFYPFKIVIYCIKIQHFSQVTLYCFCFQTFIADHPEVAVIDPIESVRLLSDRSVYYPIMRECEIKDAGTVFIKLN